MHNTLQYNYKKSFECFNYLFLFIVMFPSFMIYNTSGILFHWFGFKAIFSIYSYSMIVVDFILSFTNFYLSILLTYSSFVISLAQKGYNNALIDKTILVCGKISNVNCGYWILFPLYMKECRLMNFMYYYQVFSTIWIEIMGSE